jgi:hypothetical protein
MIVTIDNAKLTRPGWNVGILISSTQLQIGRPGEPGRADVGRMIGPAVLVADLRTRPGPVTIEAYNGPDFRVSSRATADLKYAGYRAWSMEDRDAGSSPHESATFWMTNFRAEFGYPEEDP